MINVLYADKKNIEFIGFLCDTCDIFSNVSQHKTISYHVHTRPYLSNSRMYFFLLSYVRGTKNLRTSPKKLTYDNDRKINRMSQR